jgi:hypothetical protein
MYVCIYVRVCDVYSRLYAPAVFYTRFDPNIYLTNLITVVLTANADGE